MPPKRTLQNIVLRHTSNGSKHQTEALRMLDSHYKRYTAEIKIVSCSECGSVITDCVRWSENGRTVDSWGYLEADENICYHCLDDNSFIGDIFVPTRSDAERPS